ncbi:ATP-dependent RNA helicase DHX8 [Sarcoptes scabiei]|nr:ATP-dependent RNA helicase DHX8 [Sarcoptes scabiei]
MDLHQQSINLNRKSSPQIQILQSIFEYNESRDPKILTFQIDEYFVMIKDSDQSSDWYYVVNQQGQIGYVPNSYVVYRENLDLKQSLKLIDSIASKLDAKNNDQNKILTDRQLKHAQIKLAQMRCEITQSLIKDESIGNQSKSKSLSSGLSVIQEDPNDEDQNGDLASETRQCQYCNRSSTSNKKDDSISEQLISNLIENIKLDANVSETKAIVVANSVIKTLLENVEWWNQDCRKILEILEKYANEKVNSENVYSSKLRCIFKRLWFCKDDTQQRNWPVYQDEDIINGYLEELLNLITNTDQSFLENEICSQNYENINQLIAYFQMETRSNLRIKLMEIFINLIRLYSKVSPDFFLTTVMPNELAMEMKNHVTDTDRWIKASQLFTLIFSSGHKPPINIDEHINEKFFSHQFDLCEGFDINGETIECNIPSENIISPILSFNLHINDIAENVIFKALGKRTNASHFTENLISYLNWEEDIIHTSCSLNRNQLNLDDHGNTQYTEEPHKLFELRKCLISIQHHEFSDRKDILLAQNIIENNQEAFNYSNQ